MSLHDEIIDLMNEKQSSYMEGFDVGLANGKAKREKLIETLKKIKRDIFEPDKITIHIERGLASMDN